jgi:hypothetical protein
MKKGVVIGIIIAIVVIGMISVYSISQNSNIDEITPSDVTPKPTGVNHSVELSEGLTMTAPGP